MSVRDSEVRTLHLLAADDWGGTEVQVAELLRRAIGRDSRQGLAVLDPRGILHQQLAADGVEVHRLSARGGNLGSAYRLSRLLSCNRWDVLEAYGFRAGMAARAAFVLTRRRPALVMGVRGLHFAEAEDPSGLRTRVVLAGERLLTRTVAAYDANSDGARRFLVGRGFPEERFAVIRNGVAPAPGVTAEEIVARAPNEPPVVICVARFVPRKRHDLLLEAVAEVASRGLKFRCVLIGHGPTEEQTRQAASRLGLEETVEFSGRLAQPQVLERLRGADVSALCSMWEGMPGSVLEAMAAGVPVVATRVSGTDEVVLHGDTGLLVESDDVHALADALAQLLTEPAMRRRMGQAALAEVEARYSFDRLLAEKEKLFRRVHEQGRP